MKILLTLLLFQFLFSCSSEAQKSQNNDSEKSMKVQIKSVPGDAVIKETTENWKQKIIYYKAEKKLISIRHMEDTGKKLENELTISEFKDLSEKYEFTVGGDFKRMVIVFYKNENPSKITFEEEGVMITMIGDVTVEIKD